MGHLDVMKSLLRSAAQSAAAPWSRAGVAGELRKRLATLSLLHTEVSEQALTRAVGQAPGVAAATVRIAHGRIAVQLETDDGRGHAVTLEPEAISFAPRGAKEISFLVTPPDLAGHGQTIDACAALSGEIARALWHPVLRGQPRGNHLAFVHRCGARLTADLRTVPEVRSACQRSLSANIIDTMSLSRIEPRPGTLILRLGLYRF